MQEDRLTALEARMNRLEGTLARRNEREQSASDDVVRIREIMWSVAKFYGVTVLDLKSNRRSFPLCQHRQVAMYLSKRLTLRSLAEIARCFGDRDHTTAMHGVRKIEERILSNPELREQVTDLEAKFA